MSDEASENGSETSENGSAPRAREEHPGDGARHEHPGGRAYEEHPGGDAHAEHPGGDAQDGHPGVNHPGEEHGASLGQRVNWLRAGVLGANDGVVSTAGLVVGVAGATDNRGTLLTAGIAGLLAGSMSMAAGEYVSVSTQRDTERAALALERRELREQPEEELEELTQLLQERGLDRAVAREAAQQFTERDALRVHAAVELGINPDELTNPWHAAFASFLAFTAGALLPLAAIVLPPSDWRLAVTVVSVLATLVLTGWTSARLGAAPVRAAILRNAAGGALAMALTYAAGSLLGAAGV